jgi:prophage antirepressor-like protein
MDGLNTLDFGGYQIRITDIAGEPWWVASDVARALGYAAGTIGNAKRLTDHIPEKWKGRYRIPTLGGDQSMLCLSEQGLYFFLGRSDKDKALPLQEWIAGEVLPSIRKTGAYRVNSELPDFSNPAIAARAWADQYEQRQTLAAKVKQDAPKVEFAERVSDSESGHSIGEVAKVLGTGQNRLFAWLRKKNILMENNRPYQPHVDAGRFRMIYQKPWEDSEGELHVPSKTLVTGKGLIWLQKAWDDDHD